MRAPKVSSQRMFTVPESKRNPDVVVFSQVFYPDSISTSQLLTDLLKGMDNKTIVLTVVTSYSMNPDGLRPQRREMVGNVEVRRTGLAIDYKRSIFHRGLNYLA
jgi:hypothetical protein